MSGNGRIPLVLWALAAAWTAVAEAHDWEAEGITVTVDSSASRH